MHHSYRLPWMVLGILVLLLYEPANIQADEDSLMVATGVQVSFEYTLKLDEKSVVDSNVGNKPFVYVHGEDDIILGLQKALEGMKVGESKHVTVSPEDGYGTVDQKAIIEVEKTRIPPDAQKIGATLQGQDADGQPIYARVTELKNETVILDFNHPLAGRMLYFDIKILDLQKTSSTSP